MLLVIILQLRPRSRRPPLYADMPARCPDRYAAPLEAISIALSHHRREPSVSRVSLASSPRCATTAIAALQIPIAHRSG
jgi:hypothetical protein